MSEQNKAIARNFLETAWKKRDPSGLDKYVAADHRTSGPFTDQLPAGIEGDRAFVSAFLTAFPDVQYTIDKQEAEGDTVRTWVTFIGTNTGSLMGMPVTGKRATVHVLITDRIANGKIVETSNEWDDKDFMRQLGLG